MQDLTSTLHIVFSLTIIPNSLLSFKVVLIAVLNLSEIIDLTQLLLSYNDKDTG